MNPITWWQHLTPESQVGWFFVLLVGGFVAWNILSELWFAVFPRRCRLCRQALQGREYAFYSSSVEWWCSTHGRQR